MNSVRERSILAVRIAKFGPLREPIRMLLFTLVQFSHIIKGNGLGAPNKPIISPGLKFVLKAFLWAYFRGGGYFRRNILLEGILCFKGLGLTIKTANRNSAWAYIREGLLSEGTWRLRFRESVIYGRAYFTGGYIGFFR